MIKRSDFIGNNNPAIFAWAHHHDLAPEWLKEAEIPTEEDLSQLSKAAFAKPYTREFPCHTKEATVMSAIWDAANGAEVAESIKKFAEAHGVRAEVDNVYTTFETEMKKAAAVKEEETTIYAFVLEDEKGEPVHSLYDISDAGSLLCSADELANDFKAKKIPQKDMRKIAHTVMRAANEFGVDEKELPIQVRLYGAANLPDLAAARIKVAAFCKEKSLDFSPFAAILDEAEDKMQKSARVEEFISASEDAADKMLDAGLDPQAHDWSIEENPYAMMFCGVRENEFEKAANEAVAIKGVIVPRQALLALDDATIAAQFSEKSAGTIKEAISLLNNPDAPVTEAIEKLASLSDDGANALLYVLAQS